MLNIKPKKVQLTELEANALIVRIQNNTLTDEDRLIFSGLISFNLWLEQQLQAAKLSIHKLKKLFGFKSSEKKKPPININNSDQTNQPLTEETIGSTELGNNNETLTATNPSSTSNLLSKKSTNRDPNANHGRYGNNDYDGCEQILLQLSTVKCGDLCPCCEAAGDHGRLHKVDPLIIVRLKGQPLITGTRYTVEKARCGFCGEYYSGDFPDIIKAKYDVSCSSTLAIARYWFGSPFKRIETSQAIHGVPLADATQHDLTKKLSQDVVPVYNVMNYLAANTELMFFDDTPNIILEQKSITYASNRKGVYTTAIVSKCAENFIYLYCTSQRYAGENVGELLKNREPNQNNLLTMSDASANNTPKPMDADLLERWIICFCLVHGRRRFYELIDFKDNDSDKECRFVVDIISDIYKHDKECKIKNFDINQRLAYHREHSLPLMMALRVWFSNKLLHHEIEPNSSLGEAIRYMLKYWDKLTKFLHHPGAPIDNSICERAIKVAIRHRRNSLFFKTNAGAQKGDILMSIIHTAVRCGTNPLEYLNALQTYNKEMTTCPELWLPWNYLVAIEQLKNQQQVRLQPVA